MKKLFRPLVLGGILLLAVGLAPVMDTTPARAATVTDANLKQMLEDLLPRRAPMRAARPPWKPSGTRK